MENKLFEQLNEEISSKLGVDKLKITYQISERAKNKFGHCKYDVKSNSFVINVSRFIIGTEMEKDTLCHELAHAYDIAYIKSYSNDDPQPHGVAWKMIMDKVFGYKNIRATGLHNKGIKIIKTSQNQYNIYEGSKKRAIIKVNGNLFEIKNDKNEFFDNIKDEEYYMHHFSNYIKP